VKTVEKPDSAYNVRIFDVEKLWKTGLFINRIPVDIPYRESQILLFDESRRRHIRKETGKIISEKRKGLPGTV